MGSDADLINNNKRHWPFSHEKHCKENSAPQAKQEQLTKDMESSNVMTVQKFNVDDDDDSNEQPGMMFQRVNNNFAAEPKARRTSTMTTVNMSSADFGSQDSKGCKECGDSKEDKESKEDAKPVITRKFASMYIPVGTSRA